MTVNIKLGDTALILSACKGYGLTRQQAAYVLATAFWETARTMKPVREAFWFDEEWRKKNLRYWPWYGRGFVQLTWERNYIKAGEELGLDLTSDPDRVMDPKISAKILVLGSRDGWFTGKKLTDYVTESNADFKAARRVVNGTDRASEIAEIALEYDSALASAGYSIENPSPLAILLSAISNILKGFMK